MADYTRKINETFNEIVSGKPAGEKPKMGTGIPKLPKPKPVIRTPEPIKDPKYGHQSTENKGHTRSVENQQSPENKGHTLEEQAEYIAVLENTIDVIASELGIEPQQLINELNVGGAVRTGFQQGGMMGALKGGAKAIAHNVMRPSARSRTGELTQQASTFNASALSAAKDENQFRQQAAMGVTRPGRTTQPEAMAKMAGAYKAHYTQKAANALRNANRFGKIAQRAEETGNINEEKPLSPTELALQARLQRKSGIDLGIRTTHPEGQGLTPAGKAAEANRIELQKDTIKRLSKPSNK